MSLQNRGFKYLSFKKLCFKRFSFKELCFKQLLRKFSEKVSLQRPSFERFFKPDSTSGIRRLQFFWLGCLALAATVLAYGIVFFLFTKSPLQKQVEPLKPVPTSIETATSKVDQNEMWRYKIEEENKNLADELSALKTLFQEFLSRDDLKGEGSSLENDDFQDSNAERDREDKSHGFEDQQQTSPLSSESSLNETSLNETSSKEPSLAQSQGVSQEMGEAQEGKIIQKFSLGLSPTSHHKQPKTVDTTIPAGAFAKTVLLSGVDASSSMNAASDPRPMLLRIIDPGDLPRRFQSDLEDCRCTAGAYGDLSSERVYARLEKLTCIEKSTGEIIETQVAGYIAGSDGKAGIRGVVVSKDGQFLVRSLVGGMFAGLSNVANPQNRQAQVNPFYPGGARVSPPNMGEMFTSGMAGGVSSALDRLSQYYIDRAEQLQPVIQIAAGQVVDIVFTEGTFIGSQSVKSDIEKTREDARDLEPQQSIINGQQ